MMSELNDAKLLHGTSCHEVTALYLTRVKGQGNLPWLSTKFRPDVTSSVWTLSAVWWISGTWELSCWPVTLTSPAAKLWSLSLCPRMIYLELISMPELASGRRHWGDRTGQPKLWKLFSQIDSTKPKQGFCLSGCLQVSSRAHSIS